MLIFEPLKKMRTTILRKFPTIYINHILPVDFMTITQYHNSLYENIADLAVALATHLTTLAILIDLQLITVFNHLSAAVTKKKVGKWSFCLKKANHGCKRRRFNQSCWFRLVWPGG
jgi:hypothetical protein